ncbi:unnamed protein product [marine sediment metagenome]|uniref:Rubredoxin-like domain-containing protein n=1 Tax=marine sediment metagenome TaxID=412755 RepID=X1I2S9_9ZZZZ
MPKYQCKKCGAIWYGWAGAEEPCQKCGGKLKRVEENSNDKKKEKKK